MWQLNVSWECVHFFPDPFVVHISLIRFLYKYVRVVSISSWLSCRRQPRQDSIFVSCIVALPVSLFAVSLLLTPVD